jgi:hypothetical protein
VGQRAKNGLVAIVVLCYLQTQCERSSAIVGMVIEPTRAAAGWRWLPPGMNAFEALLES